MEVSHLGHMFFDKMFNQHIGPGPPDPGGEEGGGSDSG